MDYTELFDRYIDGQLEGKELEDFRKKLNEDLEFKKSLDEYINLHKTAEEMIADKETDQLSKSDIDKYGIKKRDSTDKGLSLFRKNIALAEKDFLHSDAGGRKRILLIRMAMAATVMVAIVITVFFYLQQSRLTNEDLFTEYYENWVKSEKVLEIARSDDNFYYRR